MSKRKQYAQVVFIDGDEGREIVDALYRVQGVVAQGRTSESIRSAINYLSEWDFPGSSEITTDTPWGTADEIDTWGGYILSSNLGLGYVALAREVSGEIGE